MNVKIYTSNEIPPVNRSEALRYAGGACVSAEQNTIFDSCLSELERELTYKVVWEEYPVTYSGDTLDLTFSRTASRDLIKNLQGSEKIVLFAATVGIAPDRLSLKYSRISPTRSLFIEAIANERIEALCDTFCAQLENARPRFSPGYGDLPLELQRKIIGVLDTGRKIGLTLNSSLLMTPTKSVTGIVGIK